jgi:histidyl-tRNA synthetase
VVLEFGLTASTLVEELNLFRKRSPNHQKRCLLFYGDTEAFYASGNTKVTKSGIKVELYPDNAKVAKQFQHADKRRSFAVIVGEQEIASNFS